MTFLRLRFPGAGQLPSSVYATRGAGHGRTCGSTTTKNDAKTVVANRDEVNRLRG